MDPPPSSTVVVVEDERSLANLYGEWLDDTYDVRLAYTGNEALALIGEHVDIVLLDRRLPDSSGEEVLSRIRDRGIECPVVMVTAVDPEFDIVDMGFDDYLMKPVDKAELHTAVSKHLTLAEYGKTIREYFTLTSKITSLQEAHSPGELQQSVEFQRLQNRFAKIKPKARAQLDQLMQEDPSDEILRLLLEGQ